MLGLSSSFYCSWTRLYQQKYNKFNQNITFISVVYIFCAVGCFSVRSNSSTSILAQRPVDVPTTKTRHCEESPEATNNWKASCEHRINVPGFFTLEQNYVFIQNFIPRPPSLRKMIFFLPCHDVPLFLLAHPFFLLTPSPSLSITIFPFSFYIPIPLPLYIWGYISKPMLGNLSLGHIYLIQKFPYLIFFSVQSG